MASNEEEPMDVNDDFAELKVRLWSSEEMEPKKFKSVITKTLQFWANKNNINGDFTATEISDNGKTAIICVTPADALQYLLNLSGKELATKEKKMFSITAFTMKEQTQDDKKPSGEHSFPTQRKAQKNDYAELRVRLWSPEEIEPKKFKSVITKTLQSWANKNAIRGEFTATEISDDGKTAVICVTPADALQELLNLSGKELATKERKIFSITAITEKEQTQDDKKPGENSFPTQRKAQNGSEESSDKGSPADGDSDGPCLVALGPYWYMKNFYPDKIQDIEKKNGVKITENVAVAICAHKKNANPKRASEEFTELVQSCCSEFGGISIPLKKVGLEELRETLKFLKTTDRKCQITISSDEITVFGPPQFQVAIGKSLQSTKISTSLTGHERTDPFEKYDPKISINVTDEERMELGRSSIRRQENAFDKDRKSPDRIKITSSFKDPFVSDGLPIEGHYWEIITNLHMTELVNIQKKFNVCFRDSDTTHGKKMIKVHYNKSEKNMSMESHAIRALLRLYQKVARSQLRQTNGSYDDKDKEEDLYSAAEDLNGATGKTSKDGGEDKNGKGLTEEGAKKKSREAEAKKDEKEKETCPVCMDVFTKKTKLGKCKHEFCEDCLERAVKSMGPVCPVCKDVFGLVEGDQPDGTMTWRTNQYSFLSGFGSCGSIEIHYNIPSGTQTAKHPDPGKLYHGTQRTAYLPDNREGNEVLMLLKKAFDQKLIFTVGTSRTSGAQNTVTWNDIHHKTSTHGGPPNFGYPDPDYLSRVKDELKAKGVK